MKLTSTLFMVLLSFHINLTKDWVKVPNLTQVTITFSDETHQPMIRGASRHPQNVTKRSYELPNLTQVIITFSDETHQPMVHSASHLPQNVTKRLGEST